MGVTGPDGAELPIAGAKPRALLSLLALNAPRACSSGLIVDAVWGEEPPPSARNAIQVYVATLRKVLRPGGVDLGRHGDAYALVGDCTVDVAEFEQLVARGRAALRSGDLDRCVHDLTAALDLWRGTPCEGIGGAPLLDTWRPALEGSRADALADLSEALLRRGDPSAAARSAHVLTSERPLDERGWIALATARYRAGQQDRALQACRQARRVLRDELGVDPTVALVTVERQILEHSLPNSSVGPADDQQPLAAPLPPAPEHLVGRESLVADVCARLLDGRRTVTLVGLGGIGKTTVAVVVAHRLAEAGRPVVFSSVESLLDATALPRQLCRDAGVEAGEDPVSALREVLYGAVLVLDNVEQVSGLPAVVHQVLDAVPDLSLLVTSRRATGVREEDVVLLPSLPDDEAERLFRARADRVRPGVGAAGTAEVARLCEMLDGIPLAIELAAGRMRTLTPDQLLRRIERQQDSVLLGSRGVAVPARQESLHRVLTESYAAMGHQARRLFELLGAFDGWVSLELLEELAAGWVDDVVDALDELVAAGLADLDLEGRTRLRTPVREFARSVGPREELDARMVQGVVAFVGQLATTLHGADAPGALAVLRRDADATSAALVHAAGTGDARATASIVTALNRYWLLSGELVVGRRWISRAVSMPGHDEVTAARLAVLDGTYASYLNEDGTQAALEAALLDAAAAGAPVDRLLVNGWCCLAANAAHHRDLARADRAAAQAATLARASGDPHLVALARDVDGHVAAYAGDHERSLSASLAGLADARRSGDSYDVVSLLVDASVSLLYLDRLDEALAFAEEAFDRTADFDVGPLLGAVLLVRGTALTVTDRCAAARGVLLEALQIAVERYPDPLATADILWTLGACAARELRDADGCRYLGAAGALYAHSGVTAEERLAGPLLRTADTLEARMGTAARDTVSALGAADPDRVVALLLR